jgi:hypothetical protein
MPAKGITKWANTGAFCAAFERDLDFDRDLVLLRFLEASLTGIDQESAGSSAAGMRSRSWCDRAARTIQVRR